MRFEHWLLVWQRQAGVGTGTGAERPSTHLSAQHGVPETPTEAGLTFSLPQHLFISMAPPRRDSAIRTPSLLPPPVSLSLSLSLSLSHSLSLSLFSPTSCLSHSLPISLSHAVYYLLSLSLCLSVSLSILSLLLSIPLLPSLVLLLFLSFSVFLSLSLSPTSNTHTHTHTDSMPLGLSFSVGCNLPSDSGHVDWDAGALRHTANSFGGGRNGIDELYL